MGIVDRIKRLLKSEVNSAVGKAEDPTKMSEQIMREFGDKLQDAINSEAQVKAIALKNRADLVKSKTEIQEWEGKLNGILDKIDKEGSTEELENLAKIAAKHYDEVISKSKKIEQNSTQADEQAKSIENTVRTLQSKIQEAKDKTKNIAARQQIAEASKTVNMALSSANTEGLTVLLDNMEEKVSKTEFIAEAYSESVSNTSDEAKIDEVLKNSSSTLDAFKAKRAAQNKDKTS